MTAQNTRLSKFWAVTINSLYCAEIDGEVGVPRITKLAKRTENSRCAVGAVIDNGTVLAVTKRLNLFVPEGGGAYGSVQRELLLVNTRYWGGGTSEIVALFLSEKAARDCQETMGVVPFDPRWRQQTIDTLKAIGKDHPYCSICTYSDANRKSPFDALCDPGEWQS